MRVKVALLLVCLGTLGTVFWPGLKFAASTATRAHALRIDGVQIVVARTWSPLTDASAIAAFTPCWTLFCSQIQSSMEVRVQPAFIGREDAWLLRTRETMKAMGDPEPVVNTMESPAGRIRCVESDERSEKVESACIGGGSGLIAAFKGARSDLNAFHSMLSSVKILGK